MPCCKTTGETRGERTVTDGLLGEEERLMKPLLSLLVLATDESSTAAGSDQHRALTIASHQCILIANDATSPIFFSKGMLPLLVSLVSRPDPSRCASRAEACAISPSTSGGTGSGRQMQALRGRLHHQRFRVRLARSCSFRRDRRLGPAVHVNIQSTA